MQGADAFPTPVFYRIPERKAQFRGRKAAESRFCTLPAPVPVDLSTLERGAGSEIAARKPQAAATQASAQARAAGASRK